jgi:hypothetical protein
MTSIANVEVTRGVVEDRLHAQTNAVVVPGGEYSALAECSTAVGVKFGSSAAAGFNSSRTGFLLAELMRTDKRNTVGWLPDWILAVFIERMSDLANGRVGIPTWAKNSSALAQEPLAMLYLLLKGRLAMTNSTCLRLFYFGNYALTKAALTLLADEHSGTASSFVIRASTDPGYGEAYSDEAVEAADGATADQEGAEMFAAEGSTEGGTVSPLPLSLSVDDAHYLLCHCFTHTRMPPAEFAAGGGDGAAAGGDTMNQGIVLGVSVQDNGDLQIGDSFEDDSQAPVKIRTMIGALKDVVFASLLKKPVEEVQSHPHFRLLPLSR